MVAIPSVDLAKAGLSGKEAVAEHLSRGHGASFVRYPGIEQDFKRPTSRPSSPYDVLSHLVARLPDFDRQPRRVLRKLPTMNALAVYWCISVTDEWLEIVRREQERSWVGETLDGEEEQHQEAAAPESATTPNAPRCGRRCLPTGSAPPDASRLAGGNESANPVPRRHLIASSAATGYRGSCALVGPRRYCSPEHAAAAANNRRPQSSPAIAVLEQIKEEWLVGNAVVAFVGALLMAQAWEPSDVKSVVPIINVTVPAFPQAVVLGIVALLAAISTNRCTPA